MFVPGFFYLHPAPRNPHAGPPDLVSHPQRPSQRCCVRACVRAWWRCSTHPRLRSGRSAGIRPTSGVVLVGALISLVLAARTRLCYLERGAHGGDGGHARPLLLACRYAGTAHGPVGPLPLACCLSLAVDGRRLLGRRQVEEDPPSPLPTHSRISDMAIGQEWRADGSETRPHSPRVGTEGGWGCWDGLA